MKSFYRFWKIWLWIKGSEKETDGDYTAEIINKETLMGNKNIAERLANEDVEVSYSTLTYIIDQYDRVVRDMICEGYSVKTSNVIFTPKLSGEWSKGCTEFNSDKHKPYVDCEPTQEMKQMINSIGIKVAGFKDSSCYISRVIDTHSGEINSTLSRGGNVVIEGENMKASEDDNLMSCPCRIFLIKINREAVDISNEISLNESNRIILRIPSNIEQGKYSLLIQVRFCIRDNERSVYSRYIESEKVFRIK